MTLSGGEPFLREDLVDICKLIYKHNRPKIINIPTNGLLTDKIIESVKELTKFCKKSQLIVNLSIDGIAEQHDELRGVKGNYAKALKTYKALKEIKAKNLTVGIHTVISKFNVKSFPAIVDHLMILHPDSYITEIAEQRQELATMGEDISPTPIQYYTAIDYLIHRIKNAEDYKKSRLARITQAFRIEYYNLVKQILRDKTQVIPCFAGIASCQISPDGEIWSCCIKAKSMGNLREYDYKFKKIWFSKAMKKERKSIKDKECYCPLANANYTNLMLNIPTLLKVFYRSFIRWSK
jgi:MoaA/NifB/PqqE/SkfB family radical SAM enzyme